jgi:hypothetical protein
MADTIYTINKKTTYYQPELNCCSHLLNYLEGEVCRLQEDAYDIAITNEYLKTLDKN